MLASELLAHCCAGLRAQGVPHIAAAASDFQREVWTAVQQIPPGSVRRYGEVAAAIGRPRAARAVGAALAA
ncbi:MAG: MGMT family protein, partial [Gammaproteobacteria bacterium]|nr:MGMT family protein [Gammaproteobacteria bacterium]